MGSIGGDELIKEFGSILGVAEALILGEIVSYRIECVPGIVGPVILEAARIRLQALGKLTPEHIKPVK